MRSEAQARELRIAHRVVFTGRRDDVPAVTAALDVAVLPSYREAQGMVILEAMALSRPVVASNVGGIPEMIEDGVSGLLVPPHDAPALAAAIVRLLTNHPAGGHAGAGRSRHGPRPLLHRADGERHRDRSTTKAPGRPTVRGRGWLASAREHHAALGVPGGRAADARRAHRGPAQRRSGVQPPGRSRDPRHPGDPQCRHLDVHGPGLPWVDQQWGAQVILASAYRLAGWSGPVVLRAALVAAIFACLFAIGRRRGWESGWPRG